VRSAAAELEDSFGFDVAASFDAARTSAAVTARSSSSLSLLITTGAENLREDEPLPLPRETGS